MEKNIKQLQVLSLLSILLLTHSSKVSDNPYTQRIDITSLAWPQKHEQIKLLHPYMVSHYNKLLNMLRIRQAALLVVLAPELLKDSQ